MHKLGLLPTATTIPHSTQHTQHKHNHQPNNRYIELGHVVVPAIEEPPLNIVRVMRADLVKGSHMYNAPVWSGTSSDNMYWQADVWQVDSSCSTFVAVRHDGSGSVRPDPSQAREPRY